MDRVKMNWGGFEDCSILNGLIDKLGTNSWDWYLKKFQKKRKP